MTTPPAGPQEARDVLASVEFVHGICPACSGSQPDHDDDCRIAAALSGAAVRGGAPAALREALEAIRAAYENWLAVDAARLSENTVDSLDELDVERLATAICATRLPVVDDAEGWKSDDECRAWAIRAVRLAATAASDASEEET